MGGLDLYLLFRHVENGVLQTAFKGIHPYGEAMRFSRLSNSSLDLHQLIAQLLQLRLSVNSTIPEIHQQNTSTEGSRNSPSIPPRLIPMLKVLADTSLLTHQLQTISKNSKLGQPIQRANKPDILKHHTSPVLLR